MAVKFSFGMLGAFLDNMRQLVFAGLATTNTLTVFLATASKAFP